MKQKKENNIKLGIFILAGVMIFLLAIFFIGKQQKLFGNTFKLVTYYRSVEGLMIGNNVRFSGIDVGTVENITILNDTMVEVTMRLDESTRKFIRKDAKATISTNGLMGDRIVNILPGTVAAGSVEEGNTLATVKPFSVDELLEPLKETAVNAQVISRDIAQISSNIRSGKGTIGRLFTDEEMAEDISSTIYNINEASGKLDENMEAMKSNFLLRGYYKKKAREAEKQKENKKEETKQKKTTPADTTRNKKR